MQFPFSDVLALMMNWGGCTQLRAVLVVLLSATGSFLYFSVL